MSRPEPLLEAYPELRAFAGLFEEGRSELREAAAEIEGLPPLVAAISDRRGEIRIEREPLRANAASRPSADRLLLLPVIADDDVSERVRRLEASEFVRTGVGAASRVVPLFVGFRSVATAGRTPTSVVPPSYAGLLPGVEYPEELRGRWREVVRRLRPDRALVFAAAELLALGGFDVAAEIAAGRFAAPAWPPRPAPKRRAAIFAIEGQDGSGKSTHLAALKESDAFRGLDVRAFKMYRHGVFHDTTTELALACKDGDLLHHWRLERLAKAFDSVKYFAAEVDAALDEADVALFDRWIGTHFAAVSGRLGWDPFARELLSVFPEADRVWLLDVPTETSIARIAERPRRTIDEHAYMLTRYREGLLDLADREGWSVLDATRPFDETRKKIADEARAVLRSRSAS